LKSSVGLAISLANGTLEIMLRGNSRPASGGEQPLRGVGEGFAGAVEAAAVGRDERMLPGDAGSRGKAAGQLWRQDRW